MPVKDFLLIPVVITKFKAIIISDVIIEAKIILNPVKINFIKTKYKTKIVIKRLATAFIPSFPPTKIIVAKRIAKITPTYPKFIHNNH